MLVWHRENMSGANFAKMLAWLAASVVAAMSLGTPAYAETKPAEAQIAIVKPLTFFKVDDLYFGTVLPGTTAGTVTVSPSNVRTKTGSPTLFGTDFQRAKFAGYGSNGQIVEISLGANQIFITGPGAPMRVYNFVIGSTPTAILSTNPQRFRINSATGIFDFTVGATLDVGANQVGGNYSGTWTITLNYQ